MASTLSARIDWLIEQNKRYAPLLDTALKLTPIIVGLGGVAGLFLWTLFSGYLGQLGQSALPVTQAGDWLFLLVFGIVVSIIFAVLAAVPAMWVPAVKSYAPSHLFPKELQWACGCSALVTLVILVVIIALGPDAVPYGLCIAMLLSGVTGAFILNRPLPTKALFWAAFTGFALSSFCMIFWLATLWTLLAPTVRPFVVEQGSMGGVIIIATILLAQIAISIWKHPAGIFVGLAITGFWVSQQASPDGGTMIPSALYYGNLGGGRPAQIAQDHVKGQICNLGVDTRPAFVFEPKGCERAAAFKRLMKLRGLNSLQRKTVLIGWKREVEKALGHPPHD